MRVQPVMDSVEMRLITGIVIVTIHATITEIAVTTRLNFVERKLLRDLVSGYASFKRLYALGSDLCHQPTPLSVKPSKP